MEPYKPLQVPIKLCSTLYNSIKRCEALHDPVEPLAGELQSPFFVDIRILAQVLCVRTIWSNTTSGLA